MILPCLKELQQQCRPLIGSAGKKRVFLEGLCKIVQVLLMYTFFFFNRGFWKIGHPLSKCGWSPTRSCLRNWLNRIISRLELSLVLFSAKDISFALHFVDLPFSYQTNILTSYQSDDVILNFTEILPKEKIGRTGLTY